MVALTQSVRPDCVVTPTIRPAPRGLGAPPSSRFRLSMLFLFRGGGIFLKLNGRKTGLGRASSKEEAVGIKCSGAFVHSAMVSSNALESILGIRLGHFR